MLINEMEWRMSLSNLVSLLLTIDNIPFTCFYGLELSMELNIFVVDAFTDQQFKGNAAAVVPLDEWIDDDLMQNIA